MKKLILSLILLSHSFVFSQFKSISVNTLDGKVKVLTAICGVVLDHNKINVATALGEDNVPNNQDPTFNLTQSNPDELKNVYRNARIGLRFYSISEKKLVKLSEVKIKKLSLEINSIKKIDIPIGANDLRIHDKYINFLELIKAKEPGTDKPLYNFNRNDKLKVVLVFENEETVIFDAVFRTKLNFYSSNILGENSGFWLPTLTFSTDGKSTSDGITFGTMPIGLALGTKFYPKYESDFYFGGSLIANWLVYTDEGIENNTSSFSINNVALGAMIDFSDWFYVGYAYGKSFDTDIKDAGSMLVVGFGANLFEIFKNKSK